MPLFRRRNKAGAPHGPVSEVNPHADLVRIPGVTPPAPYQQPERPKTQKQIESEKFWEEKNKSNVTFRMNPVLPPSNDSLLLRGEQEHHKAPSSQHIGYTNGQVSEAMDNVAKNRYPSTHANIADALKRLNGRD
jgi:hypothetical protein